MQAQNYHNTLEFDVQFEHECFCGDAMRISQVLTNLLSNACKFTKDGNIVLKVREIAGKENCAGLFFSVKDNGIGINETDIQKIFLSLSKAATATSRRREPVWDWRSAAVWYS